VPLPFRVVLTVGDVDRACALVARDAVAREIVKPQIAGLGNAVPALWYRMSSAPLASNAVEMPPLRAETPEKRCGHAPAAETAARMSLEII
jgi:hypothetical protein